VAARAAAQEEEEEEVVEQEERESGETTWSSLRIAIMRAIMRPKQTSHWCTQNLQNYSSKLSGFLLSFGTNPNLPISDLPS
jgi:predicted HTH transcriptional regulator